ncbi:MAG: hypothetical protein KDE58_23165 [Caldilineaceae bacterium]|nr:hypothetical protein [Caldilineaceae bacterium]
MNTRFIFVKRSIAGEGVTHSWQRAGRSICSFFAMRKEGDASIVRHSILWTAIALLLLSTIPVIVFSNISFARPNQTPALGVDLNGFMNFDVTFEQTGFVAEFRPGCPSTAALVQVDKEQYELRLFEGGACGNRLSIWNLAIDKDGNVTGEAWAEMVDPPAETGSMLGQWWLHTGCKMTGADPLFPGLTGTWDGETLIVDTHFDGRCDGGTMWSGTEIWSLALDVETENDGILADGLSWEDGPVSVRYGGQLRVAD